MKKLTFMLLVLIITGSTQSFAQDAPKNKKENFSWQKMYMDEAGIPGDVQAKIEVIKQESEAKVKEIRKDATLADDVKKAKIKEINKKKGENINALLTKEQKEEIKEIRERIKKESENN